MIAFLKGVLAHKTAESAVVEVQGIGFQVALPTSTALRLPKEGEEIVLQTSLVVREDALNLYGFLTLAEKEFFGLLMTVQGVGPKSALNVLSGLSVSELSKAIQQSNVALLKSITGVGTKTAQRLVVELKDKVGGVSSDRAAGGGRGEAEGDQFDEALSGMINLGYRQQEAREALHLALKKLPDQYTVEELIKESLKGMRR